MTHFTFTKDEAEAKDELNPLGSIRKQFNIPEREGKPLLYFSGNSLGLQPKGVNNSIQEQIQIWAEKGADGYFSDWVEFHQRFLKYFESIIGGQSYEFMLMNALTINLHLLLVSFYQPTAERHKIIIEGGAFPSDQYAVQSQIDFHGYNSDDAIIELMPRPGESNLRTEDIIQTIEHHGDAIALIMLGGVNYYTGQKYDMATITQSGKQVGAFVGFDLAHAAGNVELKMHDWDVDFAAWCNYKYLNCGPGAPSGIFVHEKHHQWEGPRFTGWWSNRLDTRFKMDSTLDPIQNAAGWGISNSPIFSMAPMKDALQVYHDVGMESFIKASHNLTGYLESLITQEFSMINIITPTDSEQRGCQLSLTTPNGKDAYDALTDHNVVCDWREPNVFRIAPTPLYNTYSDVYELVQILKSILIHD